MIRKGAFVAEEGAGGEVRGDGGTLGAANGALGGWAEGRGVRGGEKASENSVGERGSAEDTLDRRLPIGRNTRLVPTTNLRYTHTHTHTHAIQEVIFAQASSSMFYLKCVFSNDNFVAW